MKKQWINILIVGMTLGTAWAIRGHFGHEQGAAWAGGIGALALVLLSQRKEWYDKMLTISLSAAIGWGAGGMMSYGLVVGFGRSASFPNAAYGLLMLFVIGGLFGLLGGGLLGLSLNSTKEKRVNWGALLAEMIAGGLIFYSFLITKHQVLMTPPRHETWPVCLGAGMAMLWFMARNHYYPALRVALITTLGTGFGFAFGNFLQTVGTVLEIKFNLWNVMEYNLGFFGGASMAYGVLTSEWPKESAPSEKWENRSSIGILFFFIPLVIFIRSLRLGKLTEDFSSFSNPEGSAWLSTILGSLIFLAVTIVVCAGEWKNETGFSRKDVWRVYLSWFAGYIILSYIVKGALGGVFLLNLHLYWVNFILIVFLISMQFPAFSNKPVTGISPGKWVMSLAVILAFITLLALISISIHGEMTGAHDRFPV